MRKGVRVPIAVPGFWWVVGGGPCCPVENKGEGEGGRWGSGGGPTKEPASECACVCQDYPLEKYLPFIADRNLSSTELEYGNPMGASLRTPAPVLDKISGPMGARFLSSAGLGSGNLIGRAQFPPAPALDKNRSPTLVGIPWTWERSISGLWPEMGTKLAEKQILASPENWGKHGPGNGKNGPKFHFRFWGHFFHFPVFFLGHFFPIFQVRPKSISRPFSSPFRAIRPNASIPGPRDSSTLLVSPRCLGIFQPCRDFSGTLDAQT